MDVPEEVTKTSSRRNGVTLIKFSWRRAIDIREIDKMCTAIMKLTSLMSAKPTKLGETVFFSKETDSIKKLQIEFLKYLFRTLLKPELSCVAFIRSINLAGDYNTEGEVADDLSSAWYNNRQQVSNPQGKKVLSKFVLSKPTSFKFGIDKSWAQHCLNDRRKLRHHYLKLREYPPAVWKCMVITISVTFLLMQWVIFTAS